MNKEYSVWQLKYLHPKYLGIWLFIGFLYLCAWLPWRIQLGIGRLLGKCLHGLAEHRRHITEVNIRLCFPHLNAAEQAQLVKDIFIANSIGYMETAIAWFRSPESLKNRVEITGLEYIEQAQKAGKGVLLVGAHFSMLDLAGALSSLFFKLNVTYRPLSNALINEVMMQGRQKFCAQAIHKKNVKGFIEVLQKGEILWYPPDQDYGRKHATFATFFSEPAATITGMTWLAKAGNAVVLPYAYLRSKNNSGWQLQVYPPLNIPSGNENKDAQAYNNWLASVIKTQPDQYLWYHKRFKTRENSNEKSPYEQP